MLCDGLCHKVAWAVGANVGVAHMLRYLACQSAENLPSKDYFLQTLLVITVKRAAFLAAAGVATRWLLGSCA